MFVYLCFTLPFPKFHLEMIKVSLCGDRSVTSGNASFFILFRASSLFKRLALPCYLLRRITRAIIGIFMNNSFGDCTLDAIALIT